MRFSTFLVFLILIIPSDAYFPADIKLLISEYGCDPVCTFFLPEITSTTIKFFPQCEVVCGTLVFNSNTDLTVNQLKKAFRTMKTLKGGMKIVNSQLRDLEFLTVEKDKYFQFWCKINGLTIQNNSKLKNVDMLWDIELRYFYDLNQCNVKIENNPKLNVEDLCDYEYFYTLLDPKINGNLKDYGCRAQNILDGSRGCKTIIGGLELSGAQNNLERFSKIEQIKGNLEIHNTNLENLSFLGELEMLMSWNWGDEDNIVLNIHDNPNMTRLGLKSLKDFVNIWQGSHIANLQNLHPDFCLTIKEMSFFLELNFYFTNLHAKYCDVASCKFSNMSSLPRNCSYIFGDLKIEAGDEKFVYKLVNVTHIFGYLAVRNTKLTNLDFIGNLKYMASLDENLPIIQLISNRYLQKAGIPAALITRGEKYAIIHDNHPSLVDPNRLSSFQMFYLDRQPEMVYMGGAWGCPGDKLNVLGIKFYGTCNSLSRGLTLSNVSLGPEIYYLSNITTIYDAIEISHTNLKNLSFLGNLKAFDPPNYQFTVDIIINLHHNPEMTRFGLKSLENWNWRREFTINLEALHPDFCLTIPEMLGFLESKATFKYLDAKLCDYDEAEFSQKVCHFEKMSTLDTGCEYIIGDLSIGSGDEIYIDKLRNMTVLFGSLSIINTHLTDLNFLGELRFIVNFDNEIPIIWIKNNLILLNVELQKIEVGSTNKT
ncbi:unnamed protein product [Caenorhabditis brenneri]